MRTNATWRPAAGLAVIVLGACGVPPSGVAVMDLGAGAAGGDLARAPVEKTLVVSRLIFARQVPAGTSVGFDVDGYTAAAGDPRTCGHASLVSPTGTPGIDNQMAVFVDALDTQYFMAVDSVVQDGINSGMLLLGIRLTGIDDARDDAQVGLEVRRLAGKPSLGTDKLLEPNQTFTAYAGAPVDRGSGAIRGGVFESQPFEMALPVALLTANFTIRLRGARLRIELLPDGRAEGVLGGRVEVKNMLDGLLPLELDAEFKSRMPKLFADLADQGRDAATGTCLEFSAAISLSTRPAFIDP